MTIKILKDKAVTLTKVQQQQLKGGSNQTTSTTDAIIIEDINII